MLAAPAAAAADGAANAPDSVAANAPDSAPDGAAAAPGSSARLPLHVHARGLALGVIACVALLYALQWARPFLVPLLLGILISYTLNPVLCWLAARRVARPLGATLLTLAILGGGVLVVERVHGEFQAIVEAVPETSHKLARLLSERVGQGASTMRQLQAAATELQQASAGGQARRAARQAPAPAAGEPFRLGDWLWAGSMGLAGIVGQTTMVVFLVYFLLLSGDTFKRKLVKLTGPSLTQKKITVHILEDINLSVQRYMFMLLVSNALLALLMWGALRLLGLENAGAWAILSGLLHVMPYFGPLLTTCAVALAALLQFESLRMALLAAGASLAVATLVGTLVTTWMTGRAARMNPAAVFVSLLFWGWLWGAWGLLLGVPLTAILKVVAERVRGMEVLAELLGE
ncbi:AI-2E family transporter [Janthinobacterium sp. BJB412]|nr:AI-2E family transporter [Janthinobacterium sp. BJB412]